jgi:hypothetical protein
MVALGIVGCRNGRSRNGPVRNGSSRIGPSRIGPSTDVQYVQVNASSFPGYSTYVNIFPCIVRRSFLKFIVHY